jgi:hypothetical protein
MKGGLYMSFVARSEESHHDREVLYPRPSNSPPVHEPDVGVGLLRHKVDGAVIALQLDFEINTVIALRWWSVDLNTEGVRAPTQSNKVHRVLQSLPGAAICFF